MAAWNGPGSGLCASVARVQYQVLLILGPAGPASRAVFKQMLDHDYGKPYHNSDHVCCMFMVGLTPICGPIMMGSSPPDTVPGTTSKLAKLA